MLHPLRVGKTEDATALTVNYAASSLMATLIFQGVLLTPYASNAIRLHAPRPLQQMETVTCGLALARTYAVKRKVVKKKCYVRLYDPVRKTLRQQNIEEDGVYCVVLEETQPGKRWSQPVEHNMEHLPQWAWWLLGIYYQ